jgi:hypothetical protein
MKPRVFVVEAIPEGQLQLLRDVADVEIFSDLRRQISRDETIAAARRSDYLIGLHGNFVPGDVIPGIGVGRVGGHMVDPFEGVRYAHPLHQTHPPTRGRGGRIRTYLRQSGRAARAERLRLCRGQLQRAAPRVPESAPTHVPLALRELDNVILIPHNGGATYDSRTNQIMPLARASRDLIECGVHAVCSIPRAMAKSHSTRSFTGGVPSSRVTSDRLIFWLPPSDTPSMEPI